MTKPTLYMCRGFPASGKSTWAKAQVAASGGHTKRVNRDDLRAMLDDAQWSKTNEAFIVQARDAIINAAASRGLNVIIDDTNLTKWHVENAEALADRLNMHFQIVDFETTFEECVRRNALREGVARVPDEAMSRMKKDWDKLSLNHLESK